jgi:hypothetical protein
MDLLFQRHDLVWPSTQGWEQIRPQIPLTWHSESLRWQYSDWPLVVTRRDHHLPAEQLNLGLVFLQPDGSTQACRVTVSSHHITGHQPCLALHSVLSHLLPEWQPGLQALHQAGRSRYHFPGVRAGGMAVSDRLAVSAAGYRNTLTLPSAGSGTSGIRPHHSAPFFQQPAIAWGNRVSRWRCSFVAGVADF